jgi:hypothetical protein
VGYLQAVRCTAPLTGLGACPSRWREAHDLFRRFHCFSAPQVVREPCRRVVPRLLVHLGRLRGLIYTSDRGRRGRERTYIHFMETAPRLACDPRGTQLYILGGSYRVTPRGIEG